MFPYQAETKSGPVTLRLATEADIPALVALNALCYPHMAEENVIWTPRELASHQRTFPEGQVLAAFEGEVVGAVASLIVDLGANPLRPHTYPGITDGGYFHNHTYDGDTLYGADVYVHPDWRGRGLGAALYEARRRICRRFNLRRILAGGRIAGYGDVADQITPEEYIAQIVSGHRRDPVLSFQLREGFVVRDILRQYITDPVSRNCATLIEWANPDYDDSRLRQPKVRLACVQYQMRRVTGFHDFAEQVTYFIETAADYQADFVLLPELFSVQLLSHHKALSSLEGIRRLAEYTEPLIELLSGLAHQFGLHIVGGSHPVESEGQLYNRSFLFRPDGTHEEQDKLHITPSERKWWGISGGHALHSFATPKGRIGILICYDVEFPEAARHLADEGIDILFVPYCTDDRHGYLRVRHCAQARAIENQIYVATAGIIGNLPDVPAMDIHYGQAAVFTPSDIAFARDGIQAVADTNVETLLITDVDLHALHDARQSGSVTPRLDRRRDLFELRYRGPTLPQETAHPMLMPKEAPEPPREGP